MIDDQRRSVGLVVVHRVDFGRRRLKRHEDQWNVGGRPIQGRNITTRSNGNSTVDLQRTECAQRIGSTCGIACAIGDEYVIPSAVGVLFDTFDTTSEERVQVIDDDTKCHRAATSQVASQPIRPVVK